MAEYRDTATIRPQTQSHVNMRSHRMSNTVGRGGITTVVSLSRLRRGVDGIDSAGFLASNPWEFADCCSFIVQASAIGRWQVSFAGQ